MTDLDFITVTVDDVVDIIAILELSVIILRFLSSRSSSEIFYVRRLPLTSGLSIWKTIEFAGRLSLCTSEEFNMLKTRLLL